MTPKEWREYTGSDRAERWGALTDAQRAAIVAADRADERARQLIGRQQREGGVLPQRSPINPAAESEREQYAKPALVLGLYVGACVFVAAGLIALVSKEFVAAGVLGGSALSFVAWAQMLDHIAQAAFYTRRTAELLEKRGQ